MAEAKILKLSTAKLNTNTQLQILKYRWIALSCIGLLALSIIGCGGGSKSTSNPTPQNPVPTISSISPSSIPAGSKALTLTVFGSNFISSSVVRWGGAARSTVFVNSAKLTATIPPGDIASSGLGSITVFNPSPGGGASGTFSLVITAVSPLTMLTTFLPDAYHSKIYDYTMQVSGGIPPYSWSINQGSLPSGLTLASGGSIAGTPPAVSSDSTSNFSIQVSDDANQANTATKALNIRVRTGSLGRNNTCATATPISNGALRASISPYGDIDVYSFQGTAGSSLTVQIYAERLALHDDSNSQDVFLDSFLEILDSNCGQINYNDDIDLGVIRDSLISNYSLPSTGTYYLRVSDLRGDGRPDLIYDLHISGAN